MQRGDEHGALDRNSNARSFSKWVRTSATPSRSQIRPNSIGPPIRFAVTDSAPSASSSSALMSNTSIGELAPEAMREASAPEAANSSARPTLAITLWRTAAPSRLFSTICT